jgi:hypothetical protein
MHASSLSSTMPLQRRGARIDLTHAEAGSQGTPATAGSVRAADQGRRSLSSPLPARNIEAARLNVSKSKLMAFRQCKRRLWLEVHYPELREDSDAAKSRYETGYLVGETARWLYDPNGRGAVIDRDADG